MRIGVCIRPGYMVPVGNHWERRRDQITDVQSTATLRFNMEWARDAWGCDLFYLDSNNARYSAVQLRDLQMACPWASILAENGTEAAFGSALRYIDSRQSPGGYQMPWIAKDMYPNAQAIVSVYEDTPDEQIQALWDQGCHIIAGAWFPSGRRTTGSRRWRALRFPCARRRRRAPARPSRSVPPRCPRCSEVRWRTSS